MTGRVTCRVFAFALFRAIDDDLLWHEHWTLGRCLSRGDTELKLSLIELTDHLAHGRLIQAGRTAGS